MNLAELIDEAVRDRPDATFGTFSEFDRIGSVVARAREVATQFRAHGLRSGDVIAFVGTNSASYIVSWIAAQLAGLRTALINPTYPDQLLAEMLDNLDATAIGWLGRPAAALQARSEAQFELTTAWDGRIAMLREISRTPEAAVVGGDACDIAAFIHTSGTTGTPKFCALSHGYFLRLGRFFADSLCFSRFDTVLAPLPMFHINPLGYGLIGSLVARASFRSMDRFGADGFWPNVKSHDVTAMVLHFPPANLLVAKTTREQAEGHRVRIGFGCGPAFVRKFGLPIGLSGYGSTEAAGLTHAWHIRADDEAPPPEGPTNMAGKPRHDVEQRVSETGEILVRGLHPRTLFSGYYRNGVVEPQIDEDGWFRTGDRGRLDALGNLIFIERQSDSIRVNGEYVPIEFVEDRLRKLTSLGDFAIWRRDSLARGHEVVLFTTADDIEPAELADVLRDLPKFMRPVELIRIDKMPIDAGVGKIQRRRLHEQTRLSSMAL
ncbi:class I adenylate-forming enzyme family protein [Bradyrhizobium tunisiense]|uniref:class I adenylate-forming enzyme family protein n=1 Tax=Bradyrhizobium tunisiense TaxID=3278709 RepID=UPI0035D83FB9